MANPDTWGGFSNPFAYVWDNIKGTFVQRPADKVWYDPAFNQYKPNQYGGVGDTPYGPPDMSGGKVPPRTVLDASTNDIDLLGSLSGAVNGVVGAIGGAANSALNSAKIVQIGLLLVGVAFAVNIFKKILK